MKIWLNLVCLCLLFYSCSNENKEDDSFYTATRTEDLWRVPLIEPYEVVSATNSSLNDWYISLPSSTIKGPDLYIPGDEFQFMGIHTVAIEDSIIVLSNENVYWPKLDGQYPSTLIINAKNGDCFVYSSEHHNTQIEAKLKEFGLRKLELLPWNYVKGHYLKDQRLPSSWK